jgi:hypothetical protein
MSAPKKKCRQYNVEYLKYGFIQSPTNKTLPMCLICQKVLSNEAMKPSKLENHLKTIHADKKDKGLSYFQSVKQNFMKQPTLSGMFSSGSKRESDGLRASYNFLC